jgi:hypothetical protein
LQDQRAKDESLGNLLTSVREHVPDMKRDGGQRASDHMVHPTTLAHLRRRFCPALSNFLRNDSLTDMEERSVFYFELFEWLKVGMSCLPFSLHYLNRNADGGKSRVICEYDGAARHVANIRICDH